MSWNVTADMSRFDEALAWLAARVPYTQGDLDSLDDAARSKAFTIAGVLELRAVQTILDEMAKSAEAGTPYESFAKNVTEKLGNALGLDGYQLETVFRTNVQTSYNTGRWYQLTDPELTLLRPYLMYDSVLDSRTTEICKECDGVIRGHDDPFWLTHCPPLHHRCRSCLRSLRTSEAQRRGITYTTPTTDVPDGFGKAPPVADNDNAMPDAADFDEAAWTEFERRYQTALVELEAEQAEVNQERTKRTASQ